MLSCRLFCYNTNCLRLITMEALLLPNTEKVPKEISKSAAKKAQRKEVEKIRRAKKRKEKEVHSYENKSDIVTVDDVAIGQYYMENGLRKVYPYPFTYTTHAKGRWQGKMLVEVFTNEFKFRTIDEVLTAINKGCIKVNKEIVSSDYIVKSNDLIQNTVHRHELPVLAESVEVIADTDQVVVVNKPSSVPVHPCGQYRYNSLPYILAKEKGYMNLRGVHRLDRLTSGVLIFAKSEGAARDMIDDINKRDVYKEYICKVEGQFPSGDVAVNEPLIKLNHQLGLMKVDRENGKPASTTFILVTSDGQTSLVKCVPHTGRTHQIRVHLQWLGFPIINDPLYNGKVWGPNKGKGGDFGKTDTQLIADMLTLHHPSTYLEDSPGGATTANSNKPVQEPPTKRLRTQSSDLTNDSDPSHTNLIAVGSDSADDSHKHISETGSTCHNNTSAGTREASDGDIQLRSDCKLAQLQHDSLQMGSKVGQAFQPERQHTVPTNLMDKEMAADSGLPPFDPSLVNIRTDCDMCQQHCKDPSPESLVMYLHALKYQGPNWCFETDLPLWAKCEAAS